MLEAAALVVFAAYLICYGLKQGWEHTIGYGFRWIADKIDGFAIDLGFYTLRPLDFLAQVLRKVDGTIAHALAVAALNTEKAAVTLWHWAAQVFWWSVHETKALAIEAYHGIEHVVLHTIPDAAKWARREAISVAHRVVNQEAATARAAERELRHLAHVAEVDAQAGIRKAEHALDWSEAKVGQLDQYIDGIKARVKSLEHRLSKASIVALIGATIFTTFGLGWLRCHNVGRAGKRLCGLGVDAIDALLLGTLAVEGAVSLVGIANELVDLSDEIVPTVTGFFSELAAVPLRTAAEQGLV